VRFTDGTIWDVNELIVRSRIATEGADYLVGTESSDEFAGLAGNDYIDSAGGDDILDGGAGNDDLRGGSGSDTYRFARGSGRDTVHDYFGALDKVELAADIAPADVTLTRDSANLYLTINGTTDQLTLRNFFSSAPEQRIEQIVFADGTLWTEVEHLITLTATTSGGDEVHGSSRDDVIDGQAGGDVLLGRAGNDTLLGREGYDTLDGATGDDRLEGGADQDTLDGGEGADVLDGGAGNDRLYGGSGDDTYLFGIGSGVDSIADWDSTAGNIDTVQLGAGITPADVRVTRTYRDLAISITGTNDRLHFPWWFDDPRYTVERVQFADGTVWTAEQLVAFTKVGSSGADLLIGDETANSLSGLGGDDTIDGAGGNDVLDGGAGVDSLKGGYGNDTYRFGRGYGQDSAYDPDGSGNVDTIELRRARRSARTARRP
jgi:Ca2+-binding RTX toxin-like protein